RPRGHQTDVTSPTGIGTGPPFTRPMWAPPGGSPRQDPSAQKKHPDCRLRHNVNNRVGPTRPLPLPNPDRRTAGALVALVTPSTADPRWACRITRLADD